jgi:hypothetical protein
MSGSAGRSGGHNAKCSDVSPSDGLPVSPRQLSLRAAALFGWLLERLSADNGKSGWRRVDGALLASVAETLEDAERIASLLADDPGNLGLLRARGQVADRITRMSALVGLCPRDRSRLPEVETEAEDDDAYADLLRRMSMG